MARNADGSDNSGDDSKPHTGEPKAKRTRNRTPASCEACRKKKLRCDRLLPCDTCKARGEEEQCFYGEGSAPLHVPKSSSESADLKLQVDRLQALVDKLANQSDAPVGSGASASASISGKRQQKQPQHDSSHASSPIYSNGDNETNSGDLNLKSLDICEALGQLTVSGIIRIDAQPQSRAPLIPEARASLGTIDTSVPSGRIGTFPFSSNPDSIEKIMAILPSVSQAETVIQCFSHQLSWYIQVFPWGGFNAQWKRLQKATTADVDCSFLGVFLAVCGLGLYFLPEKHALDFPPGEGKKALVKQWLDASASALTLARFLDQPTLNSIHAMQLLVAWHIYLSSGDTSSTGFAILNIAGEATLQLGLHRDPDPNQYTAMECNMRRATFWWMVMLEALAGSSLGKTWSLFQLQHCDTKLPLEVDEDAFTTEGWLRPDYVTPPEPNMQSILLRMRIAILSKQVSDKAFSIANVSFSTVLELDRELQKLETSFPPHLKLGFENGKLVFAPGISRITRMRAYMVNIAILQEYVRLHRPFVASGSAFAQSRTSCIRASRMAIAVFKDLATFNYGGLTFKAISSCTVLCMDLISNPTSAEATDLRNDVTQTIAFLERNKTGSRMATNGSKLLQFLLQKSSPSFDWFTKPLSASELSNGRVRKYSDGSEESGGHESTSPATSAGQIPNQTRQYAPLRQNPLAPQISPGFGSFVTEAPASTSPSFDPQLSSSFPYQAPLYHSPPDARLDSLASASYFAIQQPIHQAQPQQSPPSHMPVFNVPHNFGQSQTSAQSTSPSLYSGYTAPSVSSMYASQPVSNPAHLLPNQQYPSMTTSGYDDYDAALARLMGQSGAANTRMW